MLFRIATILFRVKSCRTFEDGSDHPDVTGEREAKWEWGLK
jgi:hypothetical protein